MDRQKLYEHILTTIEKMPDQMQNVFVLQQRSAGRERRNDPIEDVLESRFDEKGN